MARSRTRGGANQLARGRLPCGAAGSRVVGLLAVAAVLAAASLPARVASAQASAGEKAAAESLFDQGLSLMRKGDYAPACQKLEQSQSIEPGIGTLLYLADCYAKVGRTASAWASFREAASAAAAQGQTQRAEAGAARARELEPSLSHLTVQVAAANRQIPGIEVQTGGIALSGEMWGVSFPVDPGVHRLTATAPGYHPWESSVQVPEGGARVEIVVPALTAMPEAVSAPAVEAGQDTQVVHAEPTVAPDAERSDGKVQRIVGLSVGAAGVVALGVGTYFGLRAISKNDEAEEAGCQDATCSSAGALELSEQAQDAATLSNVFVGLGVAMVGAGALVYLLAPSGEAEAPVTVGAALAPDGRAGGLTLRGIF